MCGIAGKIYMDSGKVSESDILRMTGVIEKRGPDDQGVFISEDGKTGIGNRRLAIIDLSEKGHQPMSFKGRYWITTNGEIYNFQSEKEKLLRGGVKFRSDCDTEVILALYDKYKEKCLEHLRGMFAFCIYDSQENTVFLARDRLGEKPLKYYYEGGVFIFASEAKAILTQKEVKTEPDFEAISSYLMYGFMPSPLTGFKNIRKLEPGSFIKIDLTRKTLIKKRYWQPDFKEKLVLSEKEWCERILDELRESTRLRMISDVPVGAFLSGGVDSSAVVATMSQLSAKPINTFTITFNDKKWNEAVYAKKVARIYKTNHTELEAKATDFSLLPEISRVFEEPFADAGCMVSYMVNALAKKHITVVLNGDGGDENFAGYPNRYLRIKRDVEWNRSLKVFGPQVLGALKVANLIKKSEKTGKAIRFFEKSAKPLYERFLSYNRVFSYEEIKELAKQGGVVPDKDNLLGPIKQIFTDFSGPDGEDAGLKFEMMYWLPDDLLAKSDLMSMAHSVEGRPPFLDHKFIELTSKIPFELKVKNNEPKYILKKALEELIPKENLYREKRGFGIPLHKWFTGELNSYTAKHLLRKNGFVSSFIDGESIRNMLDTHSEKNDFGPKLFSLLTLELWYQNYLN